MRKHRDQAHESQDILSSGRGVEYDRNENVEEEGVVGTYQQDDE